jgi:hypothetical protein
MREVWLYARFFALKLIYNNKKNNLLKDRQRKLKRLWRKHHEKQIRDLMICIEFKLCLIGKLFPDQIINEIEYYKTSHFRLGKVDELRKLSDILFLQDFESIELKLSQLVKKWKDDA